MAKETRYIALISVHGLIRGANLELGRDADTGGQTQYVVELARALAAHEAIGQVDLLTRRIEDAKVDASYARPVEEIAPGARIVRLPCGTKRYLRKETLWPYLPTFVDHALQHFRSGRRIPDWIHTHYADAGWVGAELVSLLGIPIIHTGHSLGRVKLECLLAKGLTRDTVEKRYNLARRIEAEETILDHAALVVASTAQEVEEQYALYDKYQPERMKVIPPGVELSRFDSSTSGPGVPRIVDEINRFLREPRKPLILAIARPDPRKNLAGLVRAFGELPELRELANLVIIGGTRKDIRELDPGSRRVWTELLHLIDCYDLYGHVAYPRSHDPADVPLIYRLAAKRGGLFVNPALTEPFGLTLIEAAASGLPIVATNDGGPRDIIAACGNGVLIDPLDHRGIADTLLSLLLQPELRSTWAKSGQRNVRLRYDWRSHVDAYLSAAERVRAKAHPIVPQPLRTNTRLATAEGLLVSDIDNTLVGDHTSLRKLIELLQEEESLAFGVATGRRLESALEILEEWSVPIPDLLVTAVGAEIYYGRRLVPDRQWEQHIGYRWDARGIREVIATHFGDRLAPQPTSEQRTHKISYFVEGDEAPRLSAVKKRLRSSGLHAKLVISHGRYLDILPIRCTKGAAVRWVSYRWGIPLERILAAGDSGNDESMLSGATPAVVVANHAPELERLRGEPLVLFSPETHAAAILDGLAAYGFLTHKAQSEATRSALR